MTCRHPSLQWFLASYSPLSQRQIRCLDSQLTLYPARRGEGRLGILLVWVWDGSSSSLAGPVGHSITTIVGNPIFTIFLCDRNPLSQLFLGQDGNSWIPFESLSSPSSWRPKVGFSSPSKSILPWPKGPLQSPIRKTSKISHSFSLYGVAEWIPSIP